MPGEDFPDAILYNHDGSPFLVSEELIKQDKIFLFISGSYSCPIFRREIPQIDSFRSKYGDSIKTYIVYTVEAHPQDVPSPYRDSVWLMDINRVQEVYIDQAKTFADRVKTAKTIWSPVMFPNRRKEMETILASSPIRLSGIIKNMGSKYSLIYALNPLVLMPT